MALVLVVENGKTHRIEGVGANLVMLVAERSGELCQEAGEITLTWGRHQSEMYVTSKAAVRRRE